MQQAIPGSPDDRHMDAKYRQLLHAEPGLFTMLSYVALGSSTSNSATSEPFHLSYKPDANTKRCIHVNGGQSGKGSY